MKPMKRMLAAAISGILAAGMLSALPAEAAREQLGTYNRLGNSGLYLSSSDAIKVDTVDYGGVHFSVQLPAQQEAEFRQTVWEQLQICCGLTENGTKDVFDLRREDALTDTKNKGTEANPVYTYILTGRKCGLQFYTYAANFYYWLHTTRPAMLQSFVYYPDYGCTNSASCYGYDVSEHPEIKEKIEAWLAEHAPTVEARMSDDDDILNLGWKEWGDGREYNEPYCPYHDMYEIWKDLGYEPVWISQELYRHGSEFAVDFMQWQKYYDNIPEKVIEGAMKTYGLDQVRSSRYQIMLGLSEDTVNALCKRSGSTYNTEKFYSPFEELVNEHDLAEGLNIGFAAGIDLYNTKVPEKLKESGVFCCPEITSQLVRSGMNGSVSLRERLHEDAHILVFLDRFLGLPFKVCCAEPEEAAPILSYSFHELMKMSSEELSEITGIDFAEALEHAKETVSGQDAVTVELLLDRETADRFRQYVVLAEPNSRGEVIDIVLLSPREIEEYLHLPSGMVSHPEETTSHLPKEARLGSKELCGITFSIDTTQYSKDDRGKAYLLAMQYIQAADGIYDMMIPGSASGIITLGDLNLDGVMDVADAVLLARYCVSDPGAEIKEQGRKQADVNRDGAVTEQDITEILEIIAKKKTPQI